MDEDDLPPPADRDAGFADALGGTVARFVWIAVFVAVIAAVLLLLRH